MIINSYHALIKKYTYIGTKEEGRGMNKKSKKLIMILLICFLGFRGTIASVNASEDIFFMYRQIEYMDTRCKSNSITTGMQEGREETTLYIKQTGKTEGEDLKKNILFYAASIAFLLVAYILKKIEEYK